MADVTDELMALHDRCHRSARNDTADEVMRELRRIIGSEPMLRCACCYRRCYRLSEYRHCAFCAVFDK